MSADPLPEWINPPYPCTGRVTGTRGSLILARLPLASIGDHCSIERAPSTLQARVTGFDRETVSLAPLDTLHGIHPGARVRNTGLPFSFVIPRSPAGCILDACGTIIERHRSRSTGQQNVRIHCEASPPSPLKRAPISKPFATGIRCIDSLLTLGIGQRAGIFSEAGAGKSTLLAMIARNAEVDVRVIALVGERGREVRAFIDEAAEACDSSETVFVVSTSDESPARRALAPLTATALAEYFRDQGKSVLLLIDSLTRTARALREIGLSMGEIPVRHGYTPSVYTELPRLLERAGSARSGAITAIYTVLTGNEEESDPLAEEIRSILDGHIVLSRKVSEQGIRPAIDVPSSGSRLFRSLHDPSYTDKVGIIPRLLSRLKRDRELLLLGGVPDRDLEVALKMEENFREFLHQTAGSPSSFNDACETAYSLADEAWRLILSSSAASFTASGQSCL